MWISNYLSRTVGYEVVFALAIVASLWLRTHDALSRYVICKLSAIIASAFDNFRMNVKIVLKWWAVLKKMSINLIFLNLFLLVGRRWDPWQSTADGPLTRVASYPLSDSLHSNSTNSSSPNDLNPGIWMTL